ncbi:MAG: 5-formyltetrahydrofolate cyclo-ligase [Leptolyngbyaceae cyanobacterium SL_1_1]|nr:5-formyltetrahydrofolate cyclo-ligase [Leptolyngbyaceae cyanobacterium RM1_1_2]NJO08641.1 5-formyltetrahydrofolate cyclo-ligase [Leptolyngbyaceae cyanobacterium SL_1_1]
MALTNSKSIQQKKAVLRQQLLKARQAIPPQVWRQKSDRICNHLKALPLFTEARTVLAYCSFRQEPDLSPLLQMQRPWGLPRCVDNAIIWHRWYPQGALPLRPGAYGILEPDPDAPRVEPDTVDLILVPAVACDVKGYRLGYGGGYYDRLMSQPVWMGKPTLGIVFEYARLPKIPKSPWDRQLDGICTESGLYGVAD